MFCSSDYCHDAALGINCYCLVHGARIDPMATDASCLEDAQIDVPSTEYQV